MEGARHRGRWDKKAPVGILLLLMCMFVPTRTLIQTTEKPVTCPHGDYLSEKGICCNKCSRGFKLVEECQAKRERSHCAQCPDGEYNENMNYAPTCQRCKKCNERFREVVVSPCKKDQNTICGCKDGYYKSGIDSKTFDCLTCSTCGKNEKVKQPCKPENNTVCECKENYGRVKGSCEPCKNCTAPSLPSQNTKAPVTVNEHFISIIVGFGVVAVFALVSLVFITHMVTKWVTNKNSPEPPCKSSDDSMDSCKEVLVHSDEPSEDMNVTAVPQSPLIEQESSNLPDCVPLEVEIPDLIYTVLDLVPVPQRKQLVRSLGVNDTEIEQAEMDHRSCREAHYQMLRVWALKGSPAGRGGQGRMLHWPLLQELLDKLRKMHLGQAAEELETKYGIQ